MDLMTGAAGPSPVSFVDMKIMKIPRAVAKAGGGSSLGVCHVLVVVTAVTESVIGRDIRRVEKSRIFGNQQVGIFAAVGQVAGTAILAFHRFVLEGIVRQQLGKIGQEAAIGIELVVFAVAGNAEVKG